MLLILTETDGESRELPMKHTLAYHFRRGQDQRAGKMAQWVVFKFQKSLKENMRFKIYPGKATVY